MDYFRFCESLRSRLPGIDPQALSAWEEFIADMNAGDPRGAQQMRGELYVEMPYMTRSQAVAGIPRRNTRSGFGSFCETLAKLLPFPAFVSPF